MSGCTASRPICITITTQLVDTVTAPMLLKTARSKKLDPTALITRRFTLDNIFDAYETLRSRCRHPGADGDHRQLKG